MKKNDALGILITQIADKQMRDSEVLGTLGFSNYACIISCIGICLASQVLSDQKRIELSNDVIEKILKVIAESDLVSYVVSENERIDIESKKVVDN